MIQNYQAFIDRMISRYEGNYGWDRSDSGGPTKFGITCYDLAQYMHQKMDSMARWAPIVKGMSLSIAEQIYERKYATASAFSQINSGPDCALLDFNVNSGMGRGNRYAQAIAGVPADGVMGPVSIHAINAMDPAKFVNLLCDRRMAFLRRLGIFATFGRGWTARVSDLRAYCLRLTAHPVHGVLGAPPHGYEDKLQLIPAAFAKSYGLEELQLMAANHQSHADVATHLKALSPEATKDLSELTLALEARSLPAPKKKPAGKRK
jgi:lysozyme family protein